jgi:Flp pilus assembly protein TadG
MVEFSIVIGFLLFFLLVTATFVIFLHQSLTIEHALGVASRSVAATGSTFSRGVDMGSRVAAIENEIITIALEDPDGNGSGTGIALNPNEIFICRSQDFNRDNSPPCATENAGGPGDLIVIYVDKPITAADFAFWPNTWGPAPGFNIKSSVIVRNEPYS